MTELFRDSHAELLELSAQHELRRISQAEAQRWLGGGDEELGKRLANYGSALMVDHASLYWWQDVGAHYELASAGIEPTDPVARELASVAVEPDPVVMARRRQSTARRNDLLPGGGAGLPSFDDDGNFAGYRGLSREDNDLLLAQVRTALDRGDVTQGMINSAVVDGRFDAMGLLTTVHEANKPYEEILAKMSSVAETATNPDDRERALDAMRLVQHLPYQVVEDFWNNNRVEEDPALHGPGANVREGTPVAEVGSLRFSGGALVDHFMQYGKEEFGYSWREEANFLQPDSDTGAAREELEGYLAQAALVRGEQPPEVEEPASVNWFERAKRYAGNITRPLVSAVDMPRQLTVNRLRQNVDLMVGGFSAGQSNAMTGTESGFFREPNIADASPLTPQGEAALSAAAGTAGTMADLSLVAATPFVGMAPVGMTTLGIEAFEAAAVPERFMERFRATDIGVLVEHPEMAGDGFLLSEDLTAMRRAREQRLAPALGNGDLVTFGRVYALAVGGLSRPIADALNSGSLDADSLPGRAAGLLGIPADYLASAANPGSDAYNTLSGGVDFAVAVAGPAELTSDTMVLGIRNARRLPGVNVVPLLGSSDPVAAAGGIKSTWRNSVIRPDADAWVSSWRGRKVAERLAEMTNAEQVFRAFNQRITPGAAATIADIDNADDIANFMRLMLGSEIQSVPRLGRATGWNGSLRHVDTFGERVRSGRFGRGFERWSHNIPEHGHPLNAYDLDQTYRWARDYMANASLPREVIDDALDGLARTAPRERIAYLLDNVTKPVHQRAIIHEFGRVRNSVAGKMRRAGRSSADVAEMDLEWLAKADEIVGRLTRHYIKRDDELVGFMTTRTGHAAQTPLTELADGTFSVNPMPHLAIEAAQMRFPVPDLDAIRNLRRINSPMYDVLSRGSLHPQVMGRGIGQMSRTLTEALTNVVWKPLVLLRAAYIMRVVGEEQLRIAAAGGDALVNNPTAWLAWILSGRATDDGIAGIKLSDSVQYRRAMLGTGESLRPSEVIRRQEDLARANAEVYTTFLRPQRDVTDILERPEGRGFVNAWAGNITKLHADTLAREVALAGGVTDDLVLRVMNDPNLVEEIVVVQNVAGDSARIRMLPDTHRTGEAIPAAHEADVRWYLESIEERIQIQTKGNADLRQAIATGRWMGPDGPAIWAGTSSMSATGEFVEAIAPLADDIAPDAVKGVARASESAQAGTEAGRIIKTVLEIMGGLIIEKPTSFFSRSPVFRQAYWAHVAEHADTLSRDEALRVLREANLDDLPRDTRRTVKWRLENSAKQAGGNMTAEGLDLAAKAHAMDTANDLLYTMITREQWADSLGAFAPFAEAWAEILSTWGKNLTTNPNILRRFGQAKVVLEDPDFAASLEQIPGFDTVDGQGMIFTNDYGQEMIQVPWLHGAVDLINWATGQEGSGYDLPTMGIPLNSLNVGASFLPGVGPVVSIPLRWVMPDNARGFEVPGFDAELQEVIWPFGPPTADVFEPNAWVDDLLPSWARYLSRAIGGESIGEYATAEEVGGYSGRVIAAMKYLAANEPERYNGMRHGPDALKELNRDAKRMVDEIAIAQAFSSFVGPAPAQAQFWILDDDGNVQLNTDDPNSGTFVSIITAANLHRVYLDEAIETGMDFEDAQNAAFLKLIDATGSTGSIFSTIGASVALSPGGVPATRTAQRWVNDHPGIIDAAPRTWGLFASMESEREGDDQLYMPMYSGTIRDDERERRSDADWLAVGEDVGGDFFYNSIKLDIENEMGMPAEEWPDDIRDALTEYHDVVKRAFPGWKAVPTLQRGGPTEMAIELADVTAEGGALADHDLAWVIQEMAEARDFVFTTAKEADLSDALGVPLNSVATRDIRKAYDEYLEKIQTEYPDLADIIARVYRAEIRQGLQSDREVTNR